MSGTRPGCCARAAEDIESAATAVLRIKIRRCIPCPVLLLGPGASDFALEHRVPSWPGQPATRVGGPVSRGPLSPVDYTPAGYGGRI